jgi:hypothetical protein
MLLSSQVKTRREIPDSNGQWVEIRKLGWRKLREAAESMQRTAYETVRALGKDGMDAVAKVTPEQIATFKRSPASQYDPVILLRSAVVAWSLSEKPTPDEIDDLPEDVASWLVDEIVALSKPERSEDDQKNG